MIDIIQEIIPNDKDYVRYCNGVEIITREVKPYIQKRTVTESYKENVSAYVQRIKHEFERELGWLIIKNLMEVPATTRILERIRVEDLSTNLMASILFNHFSRETDSLRIICSPDVYPVLSQVISEDNSVCNSFFIRNTFLGVLISIEHIPDDEIWFIDLGSWRLPITEPRDTIEPCYKNRMLYIYTRKFKMAPPVCLGDKLVRIKLIVESQEEKEMRELMDKMRLPRRKSPAVAPQTTKIIPAGESVWLEGNPEDELCVTKPPKDMRHKTIPQMFNPGTISDYQAKKKK